MNDQPLPFPEPLPLAFDAKSEKRLSLQLVTPVKMAPGVIVEMNNRNYRVEEIEFQRECPDHELEYAFWLVEV